MCIRDRYYTPKEVAKHNTASDCWVSFFYEVYDLTYVIQKHYGPEVDPIVKAAGTDITHWFDEKTREPKTFVSPHSKILEYYLPNGRYLHIPPAEPDSSWSNSFTTPWWRKKKLCIGKLTRKVRKLRVINMLTKDDDVLEVCSEESMNEILDRYLQLNEHAASYDWKRLGRPLDMRKTLDENDIPDETEEFLMLNIEEDQYIPAVHLYYKDDLTVS
eukprot:TRINITY_DN3276_c0_g2_i7.p1 TRINITY_DN3276_c0_g2~~TRINITY_DN3276_c0_g2_i7.p1  ORF type:complete len:216 (-),score=56.04 TRINITY_DN3276_c0_g2_i7:136-783(-)